jgi:hypothetical protein
MDTRNQGFLMQQDHNMCCTEDPDRLGQFTVRTVLEVEQPLVLNIAFESTGGFLGLGNDEELTEGPFWVQLFCKSGPQHKSVCPLVGNSPTVKSICCTTYNQVMCILKIAWAINTIERMDKSEAACAAFVTRAQLEEPALWQAFLSLGGHAENYFVAGLSQVKVPQEETYAALVSQLKDYYLGFFKRWRGSGYASSAQVFSCLLEGAERPMELVLIHLKVRYWTCHCSSGIRNLVKVVANAATLVQSSNLHQHIMDNAVPLKQVGTGATTLTALKTYQAGNTLEIPQRDAEPLLRSMGLGNVLLNAEHKWPPGAHFAKPMAHLQTLLRTMHVREIALSQLQEPIALCTSPPLFTEPLEQAPDNFIYYNV